MGCWLYWTMSPKGVNQPMKTSFNPRDIGAPANTNTTATYDPITCQPQPVSKQPHTQPLILQLMLMQTNR